MRRNEKGWRIRRSLLPAAFQASLRSPWIAAFAACITGCAPAREPTDRIVTRGLDRSERYIAAQGARSEAAPRTIAAMIGNEPIWLDGLVGPLLEASGGVVLEEAVLDRMLEREAATAGVRIDASQIDAERALLTDSFTRAGLASTPDDAERRLESIRRARGLGDERFRGLLRRNALLRALVAPSVVVSPEALKQAHAFRFGARYQARLIVAPTAPEAAALRTRVLNGEEFSALAAESSVDSSAARGGVLEPISPADPSYPASIRTALADLRPGEVSLPIAVEQGYALVRLDRVMEPSGTPPAVNDVRDALEREVRTEQERLLMNQLARRLLEEADLTIMERALDQSWRERTGR